MKTLSYFVILVLVVSLCSKLVGLAREIVVAHYFGTTSFLDFFIVANIPYQVTMMVTAGMVAPFIREYLRMDKERGKDESTRLMVNSALLTLPLGVGCFLLLCVFSRRICFFFAGRGASPETMLDVARGFRVMSLSLFLWPMIYILDACLNSQKRFLLNNLVKILPHVCLIFAIVLSQGRRSYLVLTSALIAGAFLQTFILIFSQWRLIRPVLRNLRPREHWAPARRFLFHSLLFFVATIAYNQDVVVDRYLGVRFGEGVVSALGYGVRITILPYYSLIMPMTVVLVPFVVTSHLQDRSLKNKEVSNLLAAGFSAALFFLLPLAVFVFFYREGVIRLLLMRGAFDSESLRLTSTVMKYYAPNICVLSLCTLCTGLSFSLGLRRWAVVGSVLGMAGKLGLLWILGKRIGFQVLPLGTLSACSILLIFLLAPIERAYPFLRLVWPSLWKRLAGSVIGVALVSLVPGGIVAQGLLFLCLYGIWCSWTKDPMIGRLAKSAREGLVRSSHGA